MRTCKRYMLYESLEWIRCERQLLLRSMLQQWQHCCRQLLHVSDSPAGTKPKTKHKTTSVAPQHHATGHQLWFGCAASSAARHGCVSHQPGGAAGVLAPCAVHLHSSKQHQPFWQRHHLHPPISAGSHRPQGTASSANTMSTAAHIATYSGNSRQLSLRHQAMLADSLLIIA